MCAKRPIPIHQPSQKTKAMRFPAANPSQNQRQNPMPPDEPKETLRVWSDQAPTVGRNDERTPDVIDGARFLGLSRSEGMQELGITSEKDYARAYKDVEAMVVARDNRESQGSVEVPVVIKRSGAKVNDAG